MNRRRAQQVLLVLLLMGGSVGTGVVTGLVIKKEIDASNKQQQQHLRIALVQACGRQNIRQKIVNSNAYAEWAYDRLFASDIASSSTRHETSVQRREIAAFEKRLNDAISTLAWTPLIGDCLEMPSQVQLPVHFNAALPPASASEYAP